MGAFLLQPRVLLRIEFALGFALALLLYARYHGTWLVFAVLFFVPDLSFAGYLAGSRVGAACYNVIHTLVVPVALAAAGVLSERPMLVQLALILFAHVTLDRALGFGLKYPEGPRETHLQRV